MDELLTQILIQILSYFGVLILAFIIISFLQKGFFWKWLRARTSGGKSILIKIKGVVKPIYKLGYIDEGDLCYKNKWNDKIPKRINNIKRDYIYKDLGVFWIEIDDKLNCFLTPDLKGVTGFDAEKYNSLYLRALYRPTLIDPKDQIILIVTIVTFIMCLIMIFYLYQVNKNVGIANVGISQIRFILNNLNSTQVPII